MRLNHFIIVLAAVVIIGGASGGLAGSLTSDGANGVDVTTRSGGDGTADATGPDNLNGDARETIQRIRDRVQSGELTQEQARELIQQQFQGQTPAGGRQPAPERAEPESASTHAGVIQSIQGDLVTLTWGQGEIQVSLGSIATIEQIATGSLEDLSVGDAITVVGQRTEQGVVARAIIPEGVGGGFGGALGSRPGGFGGGQRDGGGQGSFGAAGTSLVGMIESIGDGQVTVNTEQGPFVASVNEQTVVQVLTKATLADLASGQRITVQGTTSDDGTIHADSILIASGFGGPGGGGFGGGFGGGRQ